MLGLGLGDEPPRDDGDRGTPDVRKEVWLAVVHDGEPAIAAQSSKQALDHPSDPSRQELSFPCAAGRDGDVDAVHGRCRGKGRPYEAAVAERLTLKAERG